MTFTFRPAVREKSSVLIGLGGPSGSGKTMSALRLATGLADGGPIFMVDTESGRGLHYAKRFKYQHGLLTAPFAPQRYEEAIDAAVHAGAAVVIVDSMTHEHEGPGGILEWHEEELTRMAGNDWAKRERAKFTAWIKPKQAHNRLVNRLLQQPVHMIFCFRAKDKLEMVKNEKGKQEPVSIGWTPICADRFDFEMTMMLVLPPGAKGAPDLDAKATKLNDDHRDIIRHGEQITEEMGARLLEWAKGDAPEHAPAKRRTFRDYLAEKLAACQSEDDVAALGDDPLIAPKMANAEVQQAMKAAMERFAAPTADSGWPGPDPEQMREAAA